LNIQGFLLLLSDTLYDSAEQSDDPRQFSFHTFRCPDPLADAVPEMILVDPLVRAESLRLVMNLPIQDVRESIRFHLFLHIQRVSNKAIDDAIESDP